MRMLLIAGFVGASIASIDSAVAMKWKGELARAGVLPGATAPDFVSSCQAAEEPAPTFGAEDCSFDALATWLQDWFIMLGVKGTDSVLAQVDPDGSLGVTAAELVAATHDELVDLLSQQSSDVIKELCDAKGKAVPCKTAPVTGICKTGRRCTTRTCTKENGKVETCQTVAHGSWAPLCPGSQFWNYVCHGCNPVRAIVPALGVLIASGLFWLRRSLGLV